MKLIPFHVREYKSTRDSHPIKVGEEAAELIRELERILAEE